MVSDPTRVDPPATGVLGRGTTIGGRYRLESPIAAGGMATVWRAIDTVLTRPVAVKVLHAHLAADPEFVARFRREAVAAARLAHPAIVAIYDTCDDPEAIVMELVAGRTLRDELDQRGILPPGEAVAITSSICQALEAAHKAGIVHRDVKPANVLLSAGGQLKVADFGIAKAAREAGGGSADLPDLTAVGRMVGTPKYLAPEQVSGGEVDARADVYAVGAVLYEMLCGRAPFGGDNDLAVATARLHGPPPRPRTIRPTLPHRLDEIVMKALATDPADRHHSADALWADLQSAPVDDQHGRPHPQPVDATAVGDAPSFARSERSWLVPAVLVSIVAMALGLAWVLIGGTESRPDLFAVFDRGGATGPAELADEAGRLPVVDASDFDPPPGDGREHPDRVPLALDDDPSTSWTTETYRSREDFIGLKDGVGIYLDLGESRDVGRVVLDTPNEDWSASIHVAGEPAADIAGWGSAAGQVDGAGSGETGIDLDERGRYVLVWLTDLGGRSFDLRQVQVHGR